MVDVTPNFWPLFKAFFSKNGYFSKFSRYIYQYHPKNNFHLILINKFPNNFQKSDSKFSRHLQRRVLIFFKPFFFNFLPSPGRWKSPWRLDPSNISAYNTPLCCYFMEADPCLRLYCCLAALLSLHCNCVSVFLPPASKHFRLRVKFRKTEFGYIGIFHFAESSTKIL